MLIWNSHFEKSANLAEIETAPELLQ